jgi:hypothetical protein
MIKREVKLAKRLPLLENLTITYGKNLSKLFESQDISEKEYDEEDLEDLSEQEIMEAVYAAKLKPGDKILVKHKTDGEIEATVKKVVGDRIYWANPDGKMGSLSVKNAIKKIGKPKEPTNTNETKFSKRKELFKKINESKKLDRFKRLL